MIYLGLLIKVFLKEATLEVKHLDKDKECRTNHYTNAMQQTDRRKNIYTF